MKEITGFLSVEVGWTHHVAKNCKKRTVFRAFGPIKN